MVRRAFMKHASLYIFGGVLLIGALIAALNYRTLFGGMTSPHTSSVVKKPEATEKPKPLAPDTLLVRTNEARQKAKLATLSLNEHLNASAAAKAEDMAANNYYDHNNPTTGRPGYTYIYANMPEECRFVGENLYKFDKAPTDESTDYAKQVVDTWVAEAQDEKSSLFDPGYTLVGFGIKDIYVVQHFCQLKQ